jgi:hypothetical protein
MGVLFLRDAASEGKAVKYGPVILALDSISSKGDDGLALPC